MCPSSESEDDKAKTKTQTDRRELLKLAISAAAGAVSTVTLSDEAAAETSGDTKEERKSNIGRFLNLQAENKTQLPARTRKPAKRKFKVQAPT